MKIESRGISITDVPRVRGMIIDQTGVSIQFEGVSYVWNWTFAELREFHEAIGEAFKYASESPAAPVKPEKTEWDAGDPEPEGVAEVIDCDNDLWERVRPGLWRMPQGGVRKTWDLLLETWGPIRLPEDGR